MTATLGWTIIIGLFIVCATVIEVAKINKDKPIVVNQRCVRCQRIVDLHNGNDKEDDC